MIDGLIKNKIDPMWESLSTPLINRGWSPNQVTFAGLGLICLFSLLYLWHQIDWLYGITLIFAFAFDALDGAVARRRNMATKAGGYFDAMVDRYQDLAVLAAIAFVHDLWVLALVGFSGAIITSYAKARTAIEMPISNENWPDLFERLERIVFICAMLLLSGLLGTWVVTSGLVIFAVLAHGTALQRCRRATQMLQAEDQRER